METEGWKNLIFSKRSGKREIKEDHTMRLKRVEKSETNERLWWKKKTKCEPSQEKKKKNTDESEERRKNWKEAQSWVGQECILKKKKKTVEE